MYYYNSSKTLHSLASLSVLLLAVGSPAHANQETAQSSKQSNEILVIGQKKKMAEFRNLIVNHFNVSGGGKHNGQYARFAQPICPSVSGLSEKQGAAIRSRIREVAKMSGVPVASEDCRPNMFLAVVKDGAAEIKQLRRKKARLFNSLSHRERDRIEQSGGPVFSWKATEALSSDSRHSARAGTFSFRDGENGDALGGAWARGQRTQVKSKIKRSTMEGILYSYLLIDIQSLQGVSVAQLADYTTLMSLIDIDFNSDAKIPEGSILSLFSDAEDKSLRPTSLSGGDLLLLRGLYKTPANVGAPLQRSAMIHTMREGLKNPKRISP